MGIGPPAHCYPRLRIGDGLSCTLIVVVPFRHHGPYINSWKDLEILLLQRTNGPF